MENTLDKIDPREIDALLEDLHNNIPVSLAKHSNTKGRTDAIYWCEKKELVCRDNIHIRIIREGIKAVEMGGVQKYFEHKNNVEIEEETIRFLTLENLRLENKRLKRDFLYFIIGLLIGLISSNIEFIIEQLSYFF